MVSSRPTLPKSTLSRRQKIDLSKYTTTEYICVPHKSSIDHSFKDFAEATSKGYRPITMETLYPGPRTRKEEEVNGQRKRSKVSHVTAAILNRMTGGKVKDQARDLCHLGSRDWWERSNVRNVIAAPSLTPQLMGERTAAAPPYESSAILNLLTSQRRAGIFPVTLQSGARCHTLIELHNARARWKTQ
ncbi:hypothetical protein J6590_070697 [Homalodisca vitripennis]|nr:hypothetical protein J6590_070697 [Homalodisca vitripennis]